MSIAQPLNESQKLKDSAAKDTPVTDVQESLVTNQSVNRQTPAQDAQVQKGSLAESLKEGKASAQGAKSSVQETKLSAKETKQSTPEVKLSVKQPSKESAKSQNQRLPDAPPAPKPDSKDDPSRPKTPKSHSGKPHWEQLYDLSKIKQETREVIIKEKERLQEKHLRECTFKPNIHGEEKIMKERNVMETYERNKEWQQTVKEKRNVLSEAQHQKQEVQCTFKPQLNKNTEALMRSKDGNATGQIGIEKYLERQQLARAEKERVEKILSGVGAVKGKAGGGYAGKFNRNRQREEDDIVATLRQGNFAQGALILHNYLHVMDIKF